MHRIAISFSKILVWTEEMFFELTNVSILSDFKNCSISCFMFYFFLINISIEWDNYANREQHVSSWATDANLLGPIVIDTDFKKHYIC